MGSSDEQIDTKDVDIEITQKFIQKEVENQSRLNFSLY